MKKKILIVEDNELNLKLFRDLLEAHGYDTKVFEFISLEHTSKNKMILATRRKKPRDNSSTLAQIAAIKQFYGIKEHCLESLLQAQAV